MSRACERPDLCRDAGPWVPSDDVAMVAEVTSTKPRRDREAERHG